MGIATVRGASASFEGTDRRHRRRARAQGTVAVDSIDTGDENRDGHLKAPDFFDAAQYPQITFHSTAGDVRPTTARSASTARSRSRASPSRSS